MDVTTTIIGAVILALCITPLVMAYNKKKNRERKLLQSLVDNAATHSGKITNYDIWLNTAIGIDETENRLYFLRTGSPGEYIHQQVSLNDIRSVNTNGAENPEHTERIELVLEHINVPPVILEFYNEKVSLQINEELHLARKWQAIIDSRLKHQI